MFVCLFVSVLLLDEKKNNIGRLLIPPILKNGSKGSITGADSSLSNKEIIPSFVLLAITDDKMSCYVYELINGEVEVSKTDYVLPKQSSSNPALLDSLLH